MTLTFQPLQPERYIAYIKPTQQHHTQRDKCTDGQRILVIKRQRRNEKSHTFSSQRGEDDDADER